MVEWKWIGKASPMHKGNLVVDVVECSEAEAALAEADKQVCAELAEAQKDFDEQLNLKVEKMKEIDRLQAKLAAAEKARHPDLWWRPETYQDLVKKQGDTIREQKDRIAELEAEVRWFERLDTMTGCTCSTCTAIRERGRS